MILLLQGIQQMIGVLATQYNLKVKKARQLIERKDISMLRSAREETNTHLYIKMTKILTCALQNSIFSYVSVKKSMHYV